MAESRGRVWTGVVRVGPHAGDHRVAVRAAVSVAVPLVALLILGRLELSIYAGFGAFAALYGRYDRHAVRLRMQAATGAVLLAAMLLGTTLSVLALPATARVVVIATVAGGVTLAAGRWRWHPPGALFAVFAAGACASLPATVGTYPGIVIVGGAAVLWSLAVTAAFGALAVRGIRARTVARTARPLAPLDAAAWEAVIIVSIASLVAGTAGALLVGTHWYWAMVGAVAAVGGPTVKARLTRGIQRLGGTLIGVLLAAGLLALHLPPWAIIAVAVTLQGVTELFIGRNYGIAMVFVTPLALLMMSLAAPADPGVMLRDRLLETLIGVAAATAVAVGSAGLRRSRASREKPYS